MQRAGGVVGSTFPRAAGYVFLECLKDDSNRCPTAKLVEVHKETDADGDGQTLYSCLVLGRMV